MLPSLFPNLGERRTGKIWEQGVYVSTTQWIFKQMGQDIHA